MPGWRFPRIVSLQQFYQGKAGQARHGLAEPFLYVAVGKTDDPQFVGHDDTVGHALKTSPDELLHVVQPIRGDADPLDSCRNVFTGSGCRIRRYGLLKVKPAQIALDGLAPEIIG